VADDVEDLRQRLARAEAELAALTARAVAPPATVAESPQRPLAPWEREMERIAAKDALLHDLDEASRAKTEGQRLWEQEARWMGRL
jgi:hypothetical protein